MSSACLGPKIGVQQNEWANLWLDIRETELNFEKVILLITSYIVFPFNTFWLCPSSSPNMSRHEKKSQSFGHSLSTESRQLRLNRTCLIKRFVETHEVSRRARKAFLKTKLSKTLTYPEPFLWILSLYSLPPSLPEKCVLSYACGMTLLECNSVWSIERNFNKTV